MTACRAPVAAIALTVVACAAPVQDVACDDGRRFAVAFDAAAGTATMMEGGLRRVLVQLRSASGARYGDGRTEFWVKGAEAMLTEDGSRVLCRFRG